MTRPIGSNPPDAARSAVPVARWTFHKPSASPSHAVCAPTAITASRAANASPDLRAEEGWSRVSAAPGSGSSASRGSSVSAMVSASVLLAQSASAGSPGAAVDPSTSIRRRPAGRAGGGANVRSRTPDGSRTRAPASVRTTIPSSEPATAPTGVVTPADRATRLVWMVNSAGAICPRDSHDVASTTMPSAPMGGGCAQHRCSLPRRRRALDVIYRCRWRRKSSMES